MSTVAIKKVDKQLYRKVKALASLKGKTMGEVVSEAFSLWIQLAGKGASVDKWIELEELAREDNEAFEREKSSLLRDHKGQYAAISRGRILGIFNTEREALQAIPENTKHGIVTRIEDRPPRVIDLGWSVTEQFL